MITNRLLLNEIRNLDHSFLLLGPRQTGKSTLIRELKPDIEINLADEETYIRHLSNPGLIKMVVEGKKRIFLDEVQRIPSILNTIQFLIDKDKELKFFLSGSSARKLKRGHANLLPGRIVTYRLGPLTVCELGINFNINKALEIGLLPGIYWEQSPVLAKKILKSYAATYLREEVQAESLTRNMEGFSRLFNVAASRSGDFVDFSKFAAAAMIERTSAKRYFEILVETLVIEPIEAFTKSAKRRLIQHSRFYFFDVGVLNGCLENFVASPDRIGSLFEHLVLQTITSSAKALDQSIRVSVYRTEADAEVDFIVEKDSQLFAVEVKASKNIGKNDLRGLKSFREFYKKPHQSLVIYLGEESLSFEGVQILPLATALELMGF